MIEWAEYEFKRRRSLPDGASAADHLESGREQMTKAGKLTTLAELRAQQNGQKALPAPAQRVEVVTPTAGVPEFPYPLEYLWDTFLEITDAVPHDDYGAPQCLWTEILAWSELTQATLQHWELQAIVWLGRTSQTVAAQAYVDHMKKPTSTHG